MWLSRQLVGILEVSKESVDGLRVELAAVKAERDALRSEVSAMRVNSDWMRIRVNQLEMERADLMHRAYGITLPVPELVRAVKPTVEPDQFSFEDLGDRVAKRLGLPTFEHMPENGMPER